MEADLRYPIGKFHRVETLTPEQRREHIDAIAETPARLVAAVSASSPSNSTRHIAPEAGQSGR